jgi:hypothetical protein
MHLLSGCQWRKLTGQVANGIKLAKKYKELWIRQRCQLPAKSDKQFPS